MKRSRGTVPIAVLLFMAIAATYAGAQSLSGVRIHRKPGNVAGATPRKPGPTGPLGMPSDGNATYHYGATLFCADCHAVHFSESHGFDGGTVSTTAVPGGNWLPAAGPNGTLLKTATSTELCLSCHDGQSFAPDVVDSDTFGVGERSAGFFGQLGMPNVRGHKLDVNPGDLCSRCHFVGAMATASVQCIDCHNPHGNGYFRNLWWASWPGGEPPLLASIRAGATGKARYEASNVAYPAPASGDSSWREVTNMCIDCHHAFFAPSHTEAASPYHRHPGTNTEWGGLYPLNKTGANTDPANWVSGTAGFTIPRLPFVVVGATDFASATVVAPNNEVFCLSCHKAHGSENPFALRWNYGSTGATQNAGCRQCHNNVFNE